MSAKDILCIWPWPLSSCDMNIWTWALLCSILHRLTTFLTHSKYWFWWFRVGFRIIDSLVRHQDEKWIHSNLAVCSYQQRPCLWIIYIRNDAKLQELYLASYLNMNIYIVRSETLEGMEKGVVLLWIEQNLRRLCISKKNDTRILAFSGDSKNPKKPSIGGGRELSHTAIHVFHFALGYSIFKTSYKLAFAISHIKWYLSNVRGKFLASQYIYVYTYNINMYTHFLYM